MGDERSRLLSAAGVNLPEGSGTREGRDVGRPSRARGAHEEEAAVGWGGVRACAAPGAARGAGNLPEGLCLENWPAGNNGWERVPASMKGVMKHGFLQLAALTSQYCRSFATH